MQKEYFPNPRYLLLITLLCLFPTALNMLGFDFGSNSVPLDTQRLSLKDVQSDDLFHAIKGGIHHALLEWSAVSIAFVTAFISLLHFTRRRDVTVPVIGLALLGAGLVDAFHTLAATRIVGAASANTDFIPFTWALSRIFNATIMIIGVGLSIWLTRHNTIQQPYHYNKRVLIVSGLVFTSLALLTVLWASSSTNLPQTMYPDAFITRPFDVLPLTLFIFGGTLVWSWQRQSLSLIKYGLLLSLIPEIATQLHMAFGSSELFDNHFNIAHGLKIVAYACIFLGITLDLLFRTKERYSPLSFRFNKVSKDDEGEASTEMLAVGTPKLSLTIAIPATLFLLALSIATVVGGTFYVDSEKLAYQKEIRQLKIDSQYIAPMLQQYYNNAADDLLFLSKVPPVEGIQRGIHEQNPEQTLVWKQRLNTIFSRLLDSKPFYRSISYIGVEENGLELSVVKRRSGSSITVPQSRLSQVADKTYYQQTMQLDSREFYLSDIRLERRDDQIVRPFRIISQIATPVLSFRTGDPFGIIIIDTDFGAVIDEVLERIPEHMKLYIANDEGDFLYHPDNYKSFAFEFGQRYTMQDEFTDLDRIINNSIEEHFLSGVTVEQPQKDGSLMTTKIAGYYSLLDFDFLEKESSLRILFTIDENELARDLRSLRDRSTLIGLSLSFITLALAIIVSRHFVGPIQQMTRSMREFSDTQTTPSLPVNAKDEIGVLARNFHNLTVQLVARNDELKEQKFVLDQHSIVAVTDLKGTITYVNDKFVGISGYSRQELIGQNHRKLNSGYHDREFFKNMFKTVSRGRVWHGEIKNRNKNGSYYWVDTTIAPFMQKGKPVSYIAIRTDITENKEYEERLILAKEEAESATRIKSEFIASMSHEIRTPMNGVIGMVELLLNTELSQEQRHKLSVIKSSANSLLVIINDILDFSKIEAGKMDLELLPFDLSSQLTDYIQSMATKAEEKNLELILDVTDLSHSFVIGDPGRIRQVFNNLIGNALKFTETGEIVVKASTHSINDQEVQLNCKVTDTGIGIPADKLDVLFKSFRQVDASTTRKYGGTGLGLSIVKQLCELMGGDVWVTSVEGEGSCFEFSIPLKVSAQPILSVPQVNLSGLSVLVVDDNETNLNVMFEQLGNWGVNVQQASSASEAMELCEQHYMSGEKPMFDIAILDMQMPGTDGEELGKMLQSDPRFKSIKLILMSSVTAKGDAQHFANLGFSAYFPKPTTPGILHDSLSILTDSGLAETYAQPLVTSHYLKQLKRQNEVIEEPRDLEWPPGSRILLVEDNLVNQQVAEAILEEFNLFADIADNGQQALDKLLESATEEPYKVVLMDCLMPIMDGFETTRNIRAGYAGQRYKDIAIIALTANAMEQDRQNCLDAGMNDFVSKPISTEELLSALKKWLHAEQLNSPAAHKQLAIEELPSPMEKEPETQIWQQAQALKHLTNNKDLMKRVVEQALINIPDELSKLKKALADKDDYSVQRAAHTIKGVCLTLSAPVLSETARRVEADCKEGLMDKVSEQIDELQTHTNALMEVLANYRDGK